MALSSVEQKVFEIVAPFLIRNGVERQPQLDDDLRDVGLDSIAFINILLAVEEAFLIEFADDLLLPEQYKSIRLISLMVSKYL